MAMGFWANAQNPNVAIDSVATHENVTVTDSTITIYGRGGININPALTDQRCRFFFRSQDGLSYTDTMYYVGPTTQFALVARGLSEATTKNWKMVAQRVDTTGGQDVVIVEVSTYYISGTTMWMHDQPFITSGIVSDTGQTYVTFDVEFDGHAGSYARPSYYDVAVGPSSVQMANDSIFGQGPNASGSLTISNLLPGHTYWQQWIVTDWQIGEFSTYPPGTFTTLSPGDVTYVISQGGANADSIQICFDLVSNDQWGSYVLFDPLYNIVASGTYTADTSVCAWYAANIPMTEVDFTLEVQNSVFLEDVPFTGATTGLYNPDVSIVSIVNTGWYTADVSIATNAYGGQGGQVWLEISPNNVLGPYNVPSGPYVFTVGVTGLSVNSVYAFEASLLQTADSQQSSDIEPYATDVLPVPTSNHNSTVSSAMYSFCITDVTTSDPNGATVHFQLTSQGGINPIVFDTTFVWTGIPLCLTVPLNASSGYNWSYTVTDVIGSYQTGGSFNTGPPGASPVMNMGNGNPDPNSTWASVGFWMNPDPTDPSATGEATLKVGTAPGLIITPVDVRTVPEVGNYAFEFDYSPFQEVGQTVQLWFTMDATNSNGGYGQFQSNNWMTLPALPDTTPAPVQLDGVTILSQDTLSIGTTTATVIGVIDVGDSTNNNVMLHAEYIVSNNTLMSGMVPAPIYGQYTISLPNLVAGQLTYYRLVATVSGIPVAYGAWMSFMTDQVPVVVPPVLEGPEVIESDTLVVNTTSATLVFDLFRGDSTGLYFDVKYSQSGPEMFTTVQPFPLNGMYTVNLSSLIDGTLTLYQLRILDNQNNVLVLGPVRQFMTDAAIVVIPPVLEGPEVIESDTVSVDSTSAILHFNLTAGDSTGVTQQMEITQGQASVFTSPSAVTSGWYTVYATSLMSSTFTSCRIILSDQNGPLVYGPWVTFMTDAGPVVVDPPGPTDSVQVGAHYVEAVFHNGASVSWVINRNGIENVQAYAGWGVFSPNENLTPVQDVILNESYFFTFPALSAETTYIYKLFITVDGVPDEATTDVYWLSTGPNGIEEILARNPDVEGTVVDILGRTTKRIKLRELIRENSGFKGIVFWTDLDGNTVKVLAK